MNQTESTQAENAQGFLRLPEVLKLIPVSKATWWAGVKTGRYPPSRHLGPRTTAWLASDIQAWISSAAAQKTNIFR
jgi:prophage regulatory protein